MATLNAVPIRAPYVDWILEGKKTWEIRSRATKIRGTIGLIKSGSLTVVGVADIVDVIGPLTLEMARKNARSKMNMSPSDFDEPPDRDAFAWVLDNVRRFSKPIPYDHPSGAVTWVKLNEATTAKVLAAAKSATHG